MIPLHTTTIRVLRITNDPYADPADVDSAPADVIASGVRANISSPTGRERNIGGTQEVVEFSLSCDPVDLVNTDTVIDETTGIVYGVSWVTQRVGFGLAHTRAGLKTVKGLAA
jgi:hypothetical protein